MNTEEININAQKCLLGIRDNLLKPMAAEIKANTDASREKILLNQKKSSILLWFLLIGTIINFCGIVVILYLLLK